MIIEAQIKKTVNLVETEMFSVNPFLVLKSVSSYTEAKIMVRLDETTGNFNICQVSKYTQGYMGVTTQIQKDEFAVSCAIEAFYQSVTGGEVSSETLDNFKAFYNEAMKNQNIFAEGL